MGLLDRRPSPSEYIKASDITVATDLARSSDLATLRARLTTLENGAGITPAPARPAAPSTTAQPTFWLRGDLIKTSGTTVTGWNDATPAALGSSVPTGKTAPTYVASAVGGKPGASFVKTVPNGLYWAKPLIGQGQTILTVATTSEIGVGKLILCGADGADGAPNLAPQVYLNGTNSVATNVKGSGSTAAFSNGAISANTGFIHRASWGASAAKTMKSVLNGGPVATSNPANFTPVATTGLGIGAIGTDISTITICEMVAFDAELSEADAHAWTVYLGSLYGITVGAN